MALRKLYDGLKCTTIWELYGSFRVTLDTFTIALR